MAKTNQPTNPYQTLYGEQVTSDKAAEMKFNFINYVETLIDMDKQHQDWLEEQEMMSNLSSRNGGENVVETRENPSQEDVPCTT